MKLKAAATFLMVASIGGILVELYWTYKRFAYYSSSPVEMLFRLFSICLPVALLLLSIALKNETPVGFSRSTNENFGTNGPNNNISVGDWLVNYLILVIPIVGLVFLIIWANDENNKIRKNWAVASLIWVGIIFVLSLFLYAS